MAQPSYLAIISLMLFAGGITGCASPAQTVGSEAATLVAEGSAEGTETPGHVILDGEAQIREHAPRGMDVEGVDRLVVIHAGRHPDGRYSADVSVEVTGDRVRFQCDVAVAEGGAFTQAVVYPWQAFAISPDLDVVVDDCSGGERAPKTSG